MPQIPEMTNGHSFLFQNTLSTEMRPMTRCKKLRLDGGSDEEDEKENKGVYSSLSSDNHLIKKPIFELTKFLHFLLASRPGSLKRP